MTSDCRLLSSCNVAFQRLSPMQDTRYEGKEHVRSTDTGTDTGTDTSTDNDI